MASKLFEKKLAKPFPKAWQLRKTMIVPQRTCIGCRRVKAKKDLIRIVRSPVQAFEKSLNKRGNAEASAPVEAIIVVDLRGKEKGRGAYVCPNIDCINRAMQPERLNKAFRIIPNSSDRVSLGTISRLKQNLLGLIEVQHY